MGYQDLFSCFSKNIAIDNPKLRKLLLLEYSYVDQEFIRNVLAQYPRLRDFHSNPPTLGPFTHLISWIATAFNATLVSIRDVREDCLKSVLKDTPKIRTTPGRFLINYYGHNEPSAAIQRYSNSFNMAYCSKIRTEVENMSPLKLFQKTGDVQVWFYLCASLILVTILIRIATRRPAPEVMMACLSALISFGFTGDSRVLRRSLLLTLWMSACLILVTYFSGEITSTVISPTKEYRMTKITQLAEKNYSMIASILFTSGSGPLVLKSVTQNFPQNASDVIRVLKRLTLSLITEVD